LRKIGQSQGDRQKCIQKRKPSKGKPITQHRKKKKERRGGKKGKCAAFFTGQKGTKKIKQKRNNNFDQ